MVWRGIWRAFFGLERSRSPARAISRVEHRLAEVDPRLAARAPLLGRVVGLSIPDNEMTAGLGPELRLASLHSLLLECLLDRASRTPLLLVLEDCHWIDELSQELLELIARNVSRAAVLMLVLHRSDAHPLARLEGFAHVRTVRLARLADQEAHQLIRARAGGADVPERVVDAIAAKASGNPFYIEELLNFVRDRGVGFDGGALELPATLNNVVLARVDRLSERAGSSLRVASAIGRAFPARWIWAAIRRSGGPRDPNGPRHAHAARPDRARPPEPNLTYAFRHAVVHDAVYGSLAYATRSSLHERVGCFVEQLHADDPEPVLDVLAHHFDRATDQAKRRKYLLAAGDAAKARYANEAAISYFERLAPLVEGAERSAVLRRLGEVEQIVGRWSDATTHYRDAIALAAEAGAGRERAHAECSLGDLLSWTEAVPEALELLQRALASFEALGDARGIGRTLESLSEVYYHQGSHPSGLACAERHREVAAAADDAAGVSSALWDSGRHRWRIGDERGAAADFETALTLAEDLRDTPMIAFAANDLAGLCVQRGDLAAALAHLRKAYEATRDAGAEHWAMIAIGNAGEINRTYGEYEAAYAHYEHAIRSAMELGDLGSVLTFVGNAGMAAAADGHVAEATLLLEQAVGMARRLGEERSLREYLIHLAELREGDANYDEAEQLNHDAIGLAERLGDIDGQFTADCRGRGLRRREAACARRKPSSSSCSRTGEASTSAR